MPELSETHHHHYVFFFCLGKKALEPYNIQYWFKNARAALKRKKHRLLPSETISIPESTSKCELDSSDDIDDGEVDDQMDETDDPHQ